MAKVLGMGNALVDIMTKLKSDETLEKFSLPKGSMQLVDNIVSDKVNNGTNDLEKQIASGGSAANTIHGLAKLGVETGFVGSVGNDDMGRFFKKDMEVNKINPILFRTMNETGRAMALISSDSERTFATYLGAAVDLSEDDITQEIFEGCEYFYVEGYLVQHKEMFEKAMRLASNAGLKVCLDLASYNIVDFNYAKTYGIKMKEGRDFSPDYPGDLINSFTDTVGNFLINEKLAKLIDKPDLLGTELNVWGFSGRIVGIMKDFHCKENL